MLGVGGAWLLASPAALAQVTVTPAPVPVTCAGENEAFSFQILNNAADPFVVAPDLLASPAGCDEYYLLDWAVDPIAGFGSRTIEGSVVYSPGTPAACAFSLGTIEDMVAGAPFVVGDAGANQLVVEVQAPTCQAASSVSILFGGEAPILAIGEVERGATASPFPVFVDGATAGAWLDVSAMPGVTFNEPSTCAGAPTCAWNGSDAVSLQFAPTRIGNAAGLFEVRAAENGPVLGSAQISATGVLTPINFGVVFVGDRAIVGDTYEHLQPGHRFRGLDLHDAVPRLDPSQYDFYFQALPSGFTGCDDYSAGDLVHCDFDEAYGGTSVTLEANCAPRGVGYLSDVLTATTTQAADAPTRALTAIAVRLSADDNPGQPITPPAGHGFGEVAMNATMTRTFTLEVPAGVSLNEPTEGLQLTPEFAVTSVAGLFFDPVIDTTVRYAITVAYSPMGPAGALDVAALPVSLGLPDGSNSILSIPLWAIPAPAAVQAAVANDPTGLGCVGTPTSLEATLTNTGDGVLHLNNLTIDEPFAIEGGAPPTLAPGASSTVHVVTTPASADTTTGTLHWSITELGDVTSEITVTANASFAVTAGDLTFDNTEVGAFTSWVPVTLQTCAGGPQHISVVISGDVDQFELDPPGAMIDVAGGVPTNLAVRYRPTQAGASTATVMLTYDGEPVALDLTGTGVETGGGDDDGSDDGSADDGGSDDPSDARTTYYNCNAGTGSGAGVLALIVGLLLGGGTRRRRGR